MYAVKVVQGWERAEVRHISSGFLPTYRVKTDSADRSVRRLVVPGYVFTLVRVRNAVQVPDGEWEVIDRLSDSADSAMDQDGKFVSGPLVGLEQYVIWRGPDFVELSVNLLGETRRYRLPCQVAEGTGELKKNGEDVSGMAKEKTVYTDEQKAAMIARADEIGVKAAAEEYGVPWQVVAQAKRWAAEKSGSEKTASAGKASGKKTRGKKAAAKGASDSVPSDKKTRVRKPSVKKTGAAVKEEKSEAGKNIAPGRPATALEIENASLREQVKELKATVVKLKKALADML